MGAGQLDVVTGAFGYTGKYITERLLSSGKSVRTLTGHPNRPNPFGDRVSVARYEFEDRDTLAEHLAGATTLYNTYWVRFPRGEVTFDGEVRNTHHAHPRAPGRTRNRCDRRTVVRRGDLADRPASDPRPQAHVSD